MDSVWGLLCIDGLAADLKRFVLGSGVFAPCVCRSAHFLVDAPQRLLWGAGGGGLNGGFDKHVFVRCQRHQFYIFGHLNRDGGGTST